MPRGRPRKFDREKALQDAMLVFWGNGYHAASMPDLTEAMGIDVKSLYAAFGSKDKLYLEAVELYMKATQDLLWAQLDKASSAREGLKNLLLETAKIQTDPTSHPVGCWVTMAQVDDDMPPPVATAIRASRGQWLDVVGVHLNAAVMAGELPASADVNSLSRFFVGIVQAVGIQAHDGATQAELDGLVEVAMMAWPKAA